MEYKNIKLTDDQIKIKQDIFLSPILSDEFKEYLFEEFVFCDDSEKLIQLRKQRNF